MVKRNLNIYLKFRLLFLVKVFIVIIILATYTYHPPKKSNDRQYDELFLWQIESHTETHSEIMQ